jgi:hypothetical protein
VHERGPGGRHDGAGARALGEPLERAVRESR